MNDKYKLNIKIIKKDIIPNYYVCEDRDGNRHILHDNIINSNCEEVRINARAKDLSNKDFNEWHVYHYIGGRKWVCRCSCGRYCAISGYNLAYNKSISCGHEKFEDLSGRYFGEWYVLEYAGVENGMTRWLCECSCGEKREVYANRLKNGRSISCGHNSNAIKDITNQIFGEWRVLKHAGGHSWLCRCSCGVEKVLYGYSLRNGDSRSCGHMAGILRKENMLSKYGDIVPNKNRELWQIEAVSSRENLKNYIISRGYKPTAEELSNELCISKNNVYKNIHKFELDEFIKIDYNSSQYEDEIVKIIKNMGISDVRVRDKNVINNFELDIYIPDKKLAIEFNGSYWHSDIYIDKRYHQIKSIACAKQGIQLIHIFEYEWLNENIKQKLIHLIRYRIGKNIMSIGARKTIIKDIDLVSAKLFCEEYHIQGYANSELAIGCYSGEELIGVMTIGKPRFNSKFEYELIRMCWKSDIAVNGGSSKLFKYFLEKYKPMSVVSYCDIAKFSGESYIKMGFKTSIDKLTEPNYIWYNINTKEVISRYRTQKHKLVELGLGADNDTEDNIMRNNDYVKIYNSGNLIFEWGVYNGN